jgi:hypothetical protein
MSFRLELQGTPKGRLAVAVRDEIYRHHSTLHRKYPPDYADIEDVIADPLELELLAARIEEARRTPGSDLRVRELLEKACALVAKLRK